MPSKTQSILLSGGIVGVVLAIVQFVPIVGTCLCLLAVLGAGMLAVWHYTTTYEWTLTGGTGAGMGALAAVVAAIVEAILGFIMSALELTPTVSEAMRRALEGMQAGGMTPEMIEQMRQLVESPLFFVAVFGIQLLIFALLGAIGGGIGASLFKYGDQTGSRRQRRPQQRGPQEGQTRDQPGETSWRSE